MQSIAVIAMALTLNSDSSSSIELVHNVSTERALTLSESLSVVGLTIALFSVVITALTAQYAIRTYKAVREERILSNQLVILKELVDAVNEPTNTRNVQSNEFLVVARLRMLADTTISKMPITYRRYLGTEQELLERAAKCRMLNHFTTESLDVGIYLFRSGTQLTYDGRVRHLLKDGTEHDGISEVKWFTDMPMPVEHKSEYAADHNSCFYIAPNVEPILNPVPLPPTYRTVMSDEIISVIKELSNK